MVRLHTKANIKNVFRGLQNQMEASLTFNRSIVHHPGAKGTASELQWTEMLSTYLPKRYSTEKAFVIDSEGDISDEIDIVVFDRHFSPFILKQNGVTFVPAECVYAVIEVKQTLGPTNIEYARKKAASVRRLLRTSVEIPHAGGKYKPKPPARILAGIVALDGGLSVAEQKRLTTAPEARVLNLGCSLTGKVNWRLLNYHPWDANAKPYDLQHVSDDNSLVRFFLDLVAELQSIGSVPAMDLGKYLKHNA